MKRLCLLAAVSLIASFVPAMADTVFVDADAAAKSADLESVFPGVRLSTSNAPDGVVRACDGFSEFLGRNLATSGTLVFCQDPPPLVPESWDESTNLLRADFTVETDHVQNHEIENGQMSDYKSELKSRTSVEKLLSELTRSYQKDRARGKVENIEERLKACWELPRDA